MTITLDLARWAGPIDGADQIAPDRWLVKGGAFLKDRAVPGAPGGDTAIAPPSRQPAPVVSG